MKRMEIGEDAYREREVENELERKCAQLLEEKVAHDNEEGARKREGWSCHIDPR